MTEGEKNFAKISDRLGSWDMNRIPTENGLHTNYEISKFVQNWRVIEKS